MEIQVNPILNLKEIKTKSFDILTSFSDAILQCRSSSINNDFIHVIDAILNCKGKIITTGMGKAGHAMRKFTSTLCSLSFPSAYLHPSESQHGDLGTISDNDILFVASTSGKTREILEIIDSARNINVKQIIGITSHKDSPIRDKVDLIIDMGIIKEAGSLGLAPTTSILVMLALTDTLAVIASELKGVDKKEYGKYHHGGYLGQLSRGEIIEENNSK